MNTISQSIKSAAVGGVISTEKALNIAKAFDQERENTQALLRRLEKEVGLTMGEEINIHIANMNGTKFNSVEYLREEMPANQRI